MFGTLRQLGCTSLQRHRFGLLAQARLCTAGDGYQRQSRTTQERQLPYAHRQMHVHGRRCEKLCSGAVPPNVRWLPAWRRFRPVARPRGLARNAGEQPCAGREISAQYHHAKKSWLLELLLRQCG